MTTQPPQGLDVEMSGAEDRMSLTHSVLQTVETFLRFNTNQHKLFMNLYREVFSDLKTREKKSLYSNY